MQYLFFQLSDPDHGLSIRPWKTMKGAYRLFSRLGLAAMNLFITVRRSFMLSLLAALVFCATGIVFAQAPPEASPLSLQHAASMALEKNPPSAA